MHNMKKWEKQLMNHILNEKYLGEDETPKMRKEDKKAFLEAVGNYHKLSEMVYRNTTLQEVSETLGNIVQQAEALTLQESEHWFDNVTVSRHMKQMNEAYKVFEKTGKEMTGLQQRLESAYDDMGTVLNRYYKVGSSISEDSYTVGVDDNRAGDAVDFPGSDMSMKEGLNEEYNLKIRTITGEIVELVKQDKDRGGALSGGSVDYPLFYSLVSAVMEKHKVR